MDSLEASFEKLAEASHALELQQQPFAQPLDSKQNPMTDWT